MDKIIATIKAVSSKKVSEGSIGFLTEEEPEKWYNVYDAPEKLLEILEELVIIKGNVIEFSVDEKDKKRVLLETVLVKEKAKVEKKGFNGEDMIGQEELLTAAYEKAEKDGHYLSSTALIDMDHLDFEKHQILVKATLNVSDKKTGNVVITIEDYGDAENIKSDEVKKGWIRQAVTRAKVRTLRFYTNNATAKEEVE